MADDDRENGGTPDPWEGIEAESAGDPAADMTFSLEEGPDETLALPEPSSEESGVDDELPAADLFLDADGEDGAVPVLQWESEDDDAAGLDAAGFDAAGDAAGNGAAGNEMAPEPPADRPLAVFPPVDQQDAEAAAIDIGIPSEGGTGSSAAGSSSISIQSSSIQIGTGRSGISLDEWADAAADSVIDAGGTPPADDMAVERVDEAAADAFPFDDDAFSDAAQGIDAAADEAGIPDADDMGDSFAVEQPPAIAKPPAAAEADPFAAVFGDLSLEPEPPVDVEETVAAETVAAVAGTAAAAAPAAAKAGRKATPKPVKKRAKQGGIGQMIGIVLGGLMALPITYAILIWGFQKDPFKLTKMAPPEVAFLLPQKFRAGSKRPSDSLPMPAAGGSLDDLATMAPTPAATSAEPLAPAAAGDASPAPAVVQSPADESASTEALLAAVAGSETPSAVTAPPGDGAVAATAPATAPANEPTPEPLDLSALTAAVQEADAAVDSLLAVDDPEDPVRLKLLKGWYKSLARVGEELALLETVAAETGRPLQQPPEPLAKLQGKIAGSPALLDDLGRLGRMWLKSQKRRADGVILLGTFGSTRKVGPFWHTRVVLPAPEGEQPPEVSLISRAEPVAAAGESVVATGVVFDADVVWAAECRRVEAMKAAAVEDLF